MKSLVIRDRHLSLDQFKHSVLVDLNNIDCMTCTGGLYCLKHESKCRLNDDMSCLYNWMCDAKLTIVISHIVYGTFDEPILRLAERDIANFEPYFSVVEEKSMRLSLSNIKRKLIVVGYGDMTEEDEENLRNYMSATAIFGYEPNNIHLYLCQEEEIEETLKAFGGVDLG